MMNFWEMYRKEGRKEGTKERRNEGTKERRKEGKKEGRKEGRKEMRRELNVLMQFHANSFFFSLLCVLLYL